MEYELFKQRLIEEGYIEANPKKWVRPEVDHVVAHFVANESTVKEAHSFYGYWNELDWKRGKTRMKCFKRSANTWIKNNEKFKRSDSGKTRKLSVAEQVAAGIASRENENPTGPEESGQIVADYG